MIIRPWRPPDAQPCLRLFQRAVRAGPAYTGSQRQAWARLDYGFRRWRLRQMRFTALVAEQDEQLLGFVECRPDGHVHMLFVDPSAQRKGVAGALLHAVLAEMRLRGVTRAECWASHASAPVFARHGFVRRGAALKPAGRQRLLSWRMVRT